MCTKCLDTKPLDEFYTDTRAADGATSHCKTCQQKAISDDKVLKTRARNRATVALVKAHKGHYNALYETALVEVYAEAEQLGTLTDPDPHQPGRTVVRLKGGRRAIGETVLDRIREQCTRCATYHEAGHECPTCAAARARKTAPIVLTRPAPLVDSKPDRITTTLDPEVKALREQAYTAYDQGRTPAEVAALLDMRPAWAASAHALWSRDRKQAAS